MRVTPESRVSRPAAASRWRWLPLFVLAVGLACAAWAGVAAYRVVGPYGDGPFGAGFRRFFDPVTASVVLAYELGRGPQAVLAIVDPRSGRLSDLRLDGDADGVRELRAQVEADGSLRVELDLDADGVVDRWEYYADLDRLLRREIDRVGFSLAGDGVVDAWSVDGGARIEVSTARDGVVDLWEYYADGRLTRSEADTDRDGRIDVWETFEAAAR